MKSDFIKEMCNLIHENNFISEELYDELDVKRGLRNKNGTGVLVGLTKIGSVQGYSVQEGKKIPEEGRLYYRGFLIEDILKEFGKEKFFSFEKTMFLLLFGKIPTNFESFSSRNQTIHVAEGASTTSNGISVSGSYSSYVGNLSDENLWGGNYNKNVLKYFNEHPNSGLELYNGPAGNLILIKRTEIGV